MIEFLDLKAINEGFEPELSEAIKRVLDSGWYLLGKETEAFEHEYANYIGTKHCIAVGNGFDALRLILRAYIEMREMEEGDEIIVPANTFIASILAISDNRLKPVLIEPDINTYNIDPFRIEEKITNRTRGIMLVHLYGQNAMHPEIQRLVDKYDLKLIEDNAQATGAHYTPPKSHNGKITYLRTGALGDASGHSFYPAKNLGCLGDGGAVTTNDDKLAAIIRPLSNYGSGKKYVNDYKGCNSRLDEIQAAILRVKLKHLDTNNHRRFKIAQYYCQNITNPEIILPVSKDFFDYNLVKVTKGVYSHVFHLFVIRHPSRDQLQQYLATNNIQTGIHYPIPPHKQHAFKEWNDSNFSIAEKIHHEVLSLPISPILSLNEAKKVTQLINN